MRHRSAAIMTDQIYSLRGREDDRWETIGVTCANLSVCKSRAKRYTKYYFCVEVVSQGTGRVEFRALRPIGAEQPHGP